MPEMKCASIYYYPTFPTRSSIMAEWNFESQANGNKPNLNYKIGPQNGDLNLGLLGPRLHHIGVALRRAQHS